MPRPRAVVPKYCLHKASRQAVCYVNRKPVYLGPYDSPESRREYGELLARLAAEPTRATAEPTRPASLLTVNILCLKYVTEELPRFSKSERDCQTTVIRLLRQTFGDTAAAEFGPLRLRVLRDAMIAGDAQADPPRKPWSRYTCNRQTKRVRAIFRWAAGWELIPVTVVTALQAVRSLSVGESVAEESAPRLAVPQADIDAVRATLRQRHRDVLDLLLLTGARPGELLGLKVGDIDRTGDVWRADLKSHKSTHKGKRRTLFFNATAQAILRRYLSPKATGLILKVRRDNFSPTLKRACIRAKVTPFVPHQLRHTVATKLADEMGVEAAQRLLGHCDVAMTEHYSRGAERQAVAAVQSLG